MGLYGFDRYVLPPSTEDILITGLIKPDGERYIFIYRDDADGESPREAMRTMGRWASHPDLSFTWYDAARCSKDVRDSVSS